MEEETQEKKALLFVIDYFLNNFGSSHIFLDEIHILPEYQGRGIGQQVIRNLLAEASSQDLAVELILLRSNPVRRLYEGLGFKVYKEDTDRYYMSKAD